MIIIAVIVVVLNVVKLVDLEVAVEIPWAAIDKIYNFILFHLLYYGIFGLNFATPIYFIKFVSLLSLGTLKIKTKSCNAFAVALKSSY